MDEGASFTIMRQIDMETEFSKFQNYIKNKSSHKNYKQLRDRVHKELKEVPLEDLVLIIGQMSNNYTLQKQFANIWSICNYQLQNKEIHQSYIKYYEYLSKMEDITERTRQKIYIKKDDELT